MPTIPDFQQIQPKKVLIVNIFGIGDVLFTTPIIKNLKRFNPSISLGYLCNRRVEDTLSNFADIDRVFVYERDESKALYQRSPIAYWWHFFDFMKQIKKERYDAVIDVSLTSFPSYLTWYCGIKHRIGYNYKNRSPMLTYAKPLVGYEGRHVVEYYLDLLRAINVKIVENNIFMPVLEEDIQWATAFLADQGIDPNKKLIGVVPGGGASWGKEARYKQWGSEKYAKIADKLIENCNADIILMGDQKEVAIAQQVASLMKHPVHSACGKTSVGQFAALARQCSLNILNDGGPLHIAVAAGARTASIFGPVDETVYGPYPQANHIVIKNDLACRPCYRRFRRSNCDHISCLNELSVEEVFNTLSSRL